MTGEWVKRLADDERKRDDDRLRAAEAADRMADFVRIRGQRLIDELRATVARDIETFREEFPGDPAREIFFEPLESGGGFVVRKPQYPTATLSVAPRLPAASLCCEYRFTRTSGLPVRQDRLEFMLTGGAGDTLQVKHNGTAQVFTNADALSEYLLGPVFTGRPR